MPGPENNAKAADPLVVAVNVCRVGDTGIAHQADLVAVEEPLEVRLAVTGEKRGRQLVVTVTMRTPGNDQELAVGYLVSEGIVTGPEQIQAVHGGKPNVVCVALREGTAVDRARLERHFYTTSSCGVCGKASLEAVRVAVHTRPRGPARF